MKKLIMACIASLSLFTLMSCTEKAEELNGTWVSEELVTPEKTIKTDAVNLTIEITNSNTAKIAGCSGVNYFNGEININEDKISPKGDFALTKMMGDPESEEIEANVIVVLDGPSSFELKDNVLTIYDNSKKTYVKFTKSDILSK